MCADERGVYSFHVAYRDVVVHSDLKVYNFRITWHVEAGK
jgi:hypothetical protein